MRRNFVLLLILIFMFVNMTAYAAEAAPEEVLSGDNVKISGNTSILKEKELTIQVLRPGRTTDELYSENPPLFGDVVAYQGQIKTAADGSYAFEFVINGDPGTYSYFITTYGYELADELEFYGSKYVDLIIGQINDNRLNTEETEKLITANYEKIGISAPVYEKLTAEKPDKINDLLAVFAKADAAKDISELSQQLDAAAAIVYVNEADTTEKMGSAIAEYADELGISGMAEYTVYAEMLEGKNQSIRTEILEVLTDGRTYADSKKFCEDFGQTVMVNSFNMLNTWSELKTFLEKTADITGISFSECNALSYPEKVYLALLSETVGSPSEIADRFNDAVKECKATQSSGKGSGGGSGSGSGSGGGGVFVNAGSIAGNSSTNNTASEETEKFTDLEGFEWAKEDIYFLTEKGIISGKSEQIYDPSAAITREEFVKILVLITNIEGGKEETDFTDVLTGSWYEPYINRAASAEIIKGFSDGRFGVGVAIKREDAAVMVYRAIAEEISETSDIRFADEVYISDYALDAVEQLAANGILKGKDNGIFDPSANFTRAEAAVLFRRVYDLITEEV